MIFLTVEQMRAADRAAIEETGVSELMLMMRAGAALARVVIKIAALRHMRNVVLVAGAGNNGGDACVAAYCLREHGLRVQVILTCTPATLKGAAHEAWDAMRTAGVPYVVLASPESWDADKTVVAGLILSGGVIVDGVLGTGCRGAPRGVTQRAIEWINAMRGRALVVAADLPSGMNGDTGSAEGAVVQADVTVTFARPKRCFENNLQAELSGHLVVVDIGIPDSICDRETVDDITQRLITLPELQRTFTHPGWEAHKGQLGRLLVVGGSADMPHAPVLAALGALRSGAGLATLAAPATSAAGAACWTPEAMLRTLAAPGGTLTAAALQEKCADLAHYDAIVAGPGLSNGESVTGLIAHLLADYSGSLVLDADALPALAQLHAAGDWSPREEQRLILTPHPGEAAALLRCDTRTIQADRLTAVKKLTDNYQATVILKGAGTLVCAPYAVPSLNRTGNPGLASGGTGDILAGIVGALLARGLASPQAAATAAWAHGAAGDFAAMAGSRTSLTATSLVEWLPQVFQWLEEPRPQTVKEKENQ